MRKFAFITLIVALFGSTFAIDVDAGLIERLKSSSENDFLPVLIAVERPGKASIVRAARTMPTGQRREFAVEALKQLSSEMQAPVLDELNRLAFAGSVRDIKAFWIGGSIAFEIRACDFEMLKSIDGIKIILDDSPQKIVETTADDIWRTRPMAPSDAMAVSTAMQQVNADDAWAAGITGDGVIIAILDSGVRYTHYALTTHMWTNDGEIAGNGVDDDFNGFIDDYYGYDFSNSDGDPIDDYGHGTNCAGLAAGDGAGGDDQVGVAPDALIMAIKVINSSGSGMPSEVSYGVQYAIDMGAHVLSISLGWEDPDDVIKDYYRWVFEEALAVGVIAATSAGNGNSSGYPEDHYSVPHDISAPADGPSPSQSGASSNTAIVAVGATDWSLNIADFSSYGPTVWNTSDYSDFPYPPGLMKPEIVAPGKYVRTTTYDGDGSYTNWFNGTSASCPIVAGAMALVLSKNPSLSPEQVDSLLQVSATDMGEAGHDNYFGAGLLNCDELIDNTPLPAFPILSIESDEIDDSVTGNGSGVFDGGETVRLIIEVYNRGAAATSVTATAAITADPYISVVDGSSNLGSISTGATVDNSGDPFTLTAAIGTPSAYTADVAITITAGATTSVETVTVNTGVYPRNYANHNTPTLNTTVTNFGEFGFYDPTASGISLIGQGFAFGDTNTLYGGGFLLGTAYDNVFTGENGAASEFLPVMPLVVEATSADTSYYTAYGAPGTGILISQKSTTFNSAPNEDFIILRSITRNRSTVAYPSLYIGFYLDFDIHSTSDGTTVTWFDRATFDLANEWVYMWDEAATPRFDGYVGIVGLSGISHGSVVDNSTYVYPEGMGWDDTVKYDFMSGVFSASDGSPAADWSVILSEGPFPLSPGEDFIWAVAVVAGDDLTDWQNNADAAISQYSTMSIDETTLPTTTEIKVSPNPFNATCRIVLPDGIDELKIFDLNGNQVDRISTKESFVVWDGRSTSGDRLPAGVYLIRAGNGMFCAKAILLK